MHAPSSAAAPMMDIVLARTISYIRESECPVKRSLYASAEAEACALHFLWRLLYNSKHSQLSEKAARANCPQGLGLRGRRAHCTASTTPRTASARSSRGSTSRFQTPRAPWRTG
eukprot:3362598-Pleurochrysis_carterae.AAC.2